MRLMGDGREQSRRLVFRTRRFPRFYARPRDANARDANARAVEPLYGLSPGSK